MLKSVVDADLRSEMGSNACHRIRDKGYIPGIMYGYNMDTRAIEVDKMKIDYIIRNYGTNAVCDLHIGQDCSMVMIKELQKNPITNELRHIDFQQVSHNQRIHTTVPIKLIGKEKVNSSTGVVQQQLQEVNITCLPERIPESINVDISLLAPGNPLKIADVEFGEELSVLNEPYEIVAALTKTEKIQEVDEEETLLEKGMEVLNDMK